MLTILAVSMLTAIGANFYYTWTTNQKLVQMESMVRAQTEMFKNVESLLFVILLAVCVIGGIMLARLLKDVLVSLWNGIVKLFKRTPKNGPMPCEEADAPATPTAPVTPPVMEGNQI